MAEHKGLLRSGLGMVGRNKRYVFWFWSLNLTLAEFGASSFRQAAHAVLDHSLYSERLLHAYDLSVLKELSSSPAFGGLGPSLASLPGRAYASFTPTSAPAFYFAFVFFLATAVFMPGVLQGYASRYRLPREDFFRACGRNLWRFVRLAFFSGMVLSFIAVLLRGFVRAQTRLAAESANELLPIEVRVAGWCVIFLMMTALRIGFDLAEADVVLNDQSSVLKSIASGFRHTLSGMGRLLATYIATSIVAAIVLAGGVWVWFKLLAPDNIWGVLMIGQVTLLLTLVPRFWQRGVAVAYWQENMDARVAPRQRVILSEAPVPAEDRGSNI